MKYTQEETNLIVLDSFAELTYRQKYLLLSRLQTPHPDFDRYENLLIKSLADGVYNKVRTLFSDADYRMRVIDELEQKGVTCVTFFTEGYPDCLSQIPCPPLVLYGKGNFSLLSERKFAVVGSRVTLPNVMKLCVSLSAQLCEHFAVVSGMADGADSAALEGALASGKIISVVAHGFDYVYPAFNENLTRRIERQGLLLSEYPPKIAPRKFHFPVRNRIIAGLSEALLVVSAGKKSGALITAGYALEYDRTLFAFPYTVGVASGEGCNSLLKKGGILAENILDIFSVLGLDCKMREAVALTEEERQLYRFICERGEGFVPELAEKMGKSPFQLIPLITALEIKGMIARLGGNRYAPVG